MSSPAVAPPSKLAVGLALTSVYLVWGSTYLAIAYGLEGYPPFLMGSLRFIAASLVFYAFLRWRGHAPPTRAQWKNAAVMGLCMMLLGNGLVNFAEQTVSSGLAAVAVASMPLWAGLFGVLRGQNPSRGEWLGLGIGFLGVVWLNLRLVAAPRAPRAGHQLRLRQPADRRAAGRPAAQRARRLGLGRRHGRHPRRRAHHHPRQDPPHLKKGQRGGAAPSGAGTSSAQCSWAARRGWRRARRQPSLA